MGMTERVPRYNTMSTIRRESRPEGNRQLILLERKDCCVVLDTKKGRITVKSEDKVEEKLWLEKYEIKALKSYKRDGATKNNIATVLEINRELGLIAEHCGISLPKLEVGNLGSKVRRLKTKHSFKDEPSIKDIRQAEMEFKRTKHSSILSPFEEVKYLREWRINRYPKALDRLIQGNQGIISELAIRYANRDVSVSDLVNAGNIGLLRAIVKFDLYKGVKLQTYALWWIRSEIQDHVGDFAGGFRKPRHLMEQIEKLVKIERVLKQLDSAIDLKAPKTIAKIAKMIGTEVEIVERIRMAMRNPFYFSKPVGSKGNSILGDFIPDAGRLTDNIAMNHHLRDKVYMILQALPAREARVLELFFGLNGHDSHSAEEIGRMFDLSGSMIRVLRKRALKKFIPRAQREQLKDFL